MKPTDLFALNKRAAKITFLVAYVKSGRAGLPERYELADILKNVMSKHAPSCSHWQVAHNLSKYLNLNIAQ